MPHWHQRPSEEEDRVEAKPGKWIEPLALHGGLFRLPSILGDWIAMLLRSHRPRTTHPTVERPYGDFVYLDTETTGLGGDIRIVDIAIVDDAGETLIDSLVDPLIPIPAGATAIHGIYDEDVVGMPTLADLMPQVHDAIRGRSVVIYNSSYDQRLFPGRLDAALSVHCAMRRFKQLAIAAGRGNGTLTKAAIWANHAWTGVQHRALADALAARTVWRRLEKLGVPRADGSQAHRD
jgi:hypothetical protein